LNCGTYFAHLLDHAGGDFYEILVFHLHPETLKRLYGQEFPAFLKKEAGHQYIQKVDSQEIVSKFVENLYFYFGNPALINDDILELKVKELILILLQTRNANSVKELLFGLFAPRETQLREMVQHHLYSNISVKDLAGLSNMTLATFNRRFYAIFNDTPASYIKGKRLERARELLLVSSLSIGEIAFQTGFGDLPHFSRSFKAQFRMTPAACRRSEFPKANLSLILISYS
jgi:AraC-like DNA-binding protein